MQMTEAAFTAAMEKAVARRGADWKYPSISEAGEGDYYFAGTPTYCAKSGRPTCLIGAAMFEAGMMLPGHDTQQSVLSVLSMQVPTYVILAARCAQVHQDSRQSWGESLAVYKEALRLIHEEGYHASGPWHIDRLYYQAVYNITDDSATRASIEKMKDAQKQMALLVESIAETTKKMAVSKVVIGPTFVKEGSTKPFATIEFNLESTWTPPSELMALLTGMPTKSEHALIA